MFEEKYFDDESIIEQSSAMIKRKDGSITNGIAIAVMTEQGDVIEVVLEYSELKAALLELETDRQANPKIYID
jgi:hypothetical protein